MKFIGMKIDPFHLFFKLVTLRPVGYLRRSNQQVTVNPLAVVALAMRLTTVS
jgi:hypothetical protein